MHTPSCGYINVQSAPVSHLHSLSRSTALNLGGANQGRNKIYRGNKDAKYRLVGSRAGDSAVRGAGAPGACATSTGPDAGASGDASPDWQSATGSTYAHAHAIAVTPAPRSSYSHHPRPAHKRPTRARIAQRVRGFGISPRSIAVTPAPRSSSSHRPRPARKRPRHARIAHGIARCICLAALASFAPSPSPHAHISLTALVHLREYGDPMPPRACSPRVPLRTCTHERRARLAHDIPRRIAASTGTRCLPARTPRTARAAILLVQITQVAVLRKCDLIRTSRA
ncbi:hypothetical protein DFH09DRAFT_1082453 [Mycena vulgaris]|nr:hypothetical protein DFH09DRAFT_1082453 [Mycena vulgaris]